MRRVSLLLAAVVLALGAGSAEARTVIVAPPDSAFPYQRWVDRAKVPTPAVTITVIEQPCEWPGGFAWGCTRLGGFTINVAGETPYAAFMHELGHNFDYYVLPAWARDYFRWLVADQREWKADPNGSDEGFAAAYQRCAVTGPRFRGDPNMSIKGNGGLIRQRTYRQICRMIVNVGG